MEILKISHLFPSIFWCHVSFQGCRYKMIYVARCQLRLTRVLSTYKTILSILNIGTLVQMMATWSPKTAKYLSLSNTRENIYLKPPPSCEFEKYTKHNFQNSSRNTPQKYHPTPPPYHPTTRQTAKNSNTVCTSMLRETPLITPLPEICPENSSLKLWTQNLATLRSPAKS